LAQLQAAIANANQNVGGQRITLGEQSFDVRGIGLIRSVQDIGDITISAAKGVPVRVRDVANVSVGAAPRLGIVGQDDDADVVEGIVLMRYGGDSLKTIRGIHERVDYIRQNRVLPPGMDIQTIYDRADLVKLTTHTVMENLLIGMILVSLVLWLFLGSARAALITAINLPLALMFAFTGMVAGGTAANLISLGAVDFGIVVDSTVIMMESIFRNFARKGGTAFERIVAAAREVGPPMFSSALIIAVAFIPLFTLTGVAGVIMSPMAQTYAFAIGGSILLSLTLTPMLASRMLPIGSADHETESLPMRFVSRLYAPLFSFSLRRPKLAVFIGVAPVVLALVASVFLGREFMPKLEEGNFWIRATLPMSISLEKAGRSSAACAPSCAAVRPRMAPPAPRDSSAAPRSRPRFRNSGGPTMARTCRVSTTSSCSRPLRPTSEWRKGVTKEMMTRTCSRSCRRRSRAWCSAFRRPFPTTSRKPCRASRARTR
jgi:cobalt-zinc-cadmium resistance protein CzcA